MDSAEELQKKYCSNSRKRGTTTPDRMGRRLLKNIDEAFNHFNLTLFKTSCPILDVGAGDGLGVQYWNDKGMPAVGIEFVQERVDTAKSYELDVIKGSAEDLSAFKDNSHNVFCSHTLEHVADQVKAIKELQRVCSRLIWIIVPVEFKAKSSNVAHLSPIESLEQIKIHFPEDQWIKIKEEYRTNLEPEGVIAFLRKDV